MEYPSTIPSASKARPFSERQKPRGLPIPADPHMNVGVRGADSVPLFQVVANQARHRTTLIRTETWVSARLHYMPIDGCGLPKKGDLIFVLLQKSGRCPVTQLYAVSLQNMNSILKYATGMFRGDAERKRAWDVLIVGFTEARIERAFHPEDGIFTEMFGVANPYVRSSDAGGIRKPLQHRRVTEDIDNTIITGPVTVNNLWGKITGGDVLYLVYCNVRAEFFEVLKSASPNHDVSSIIPAAADGLFPVVLPYAEMRFSVNGFEVDWDIWLAKFYVDKKSARKQRLGRVADDGKSSGDMMTGMIAAFDATVLPLCPETRFFLRA